MSATPIRVSEPCGPAWERMVSMLFRPFSFSRWFAIGFTAWLAHLGESGLGGSGGNFGDGAKPGQPPVEFNEMARQVREYVAANLTWIVPAIAGTILVLIAVYLALVWVSSRGRFMFLHNVASNRDDVAGLWSRYEAMGNSLFRFRLVVMLISACLWAPFASVLAYSIYVMVRNGGVDSTHLFLAIFSGILWVIVSIGTIIVGVLTKDFLTPIMWLRGAGSRAAWGELVELVGNHLWEFTLYLMFLIVLTIGAGILELGVILVTCCIAGCVLAIPFVGTVAMLPILVFFRAYSAGFLAQFGWEWDVFRAPAAESATDGPGVP